MELSRFCVLICHDFLDGSRIFGTIQIFCASIYELLNIRALDSSRIVGTIRIWCFDFFEHFWTVELELDSSIVPESLELSRYFFGTIQILWFDSWGILNIWTNLTWIVPFSFLNRVFSWCNYFWIVPVYLKYSELIVFLSMIATLTNLVWFQNMFHVCVSFCCSIISESQTKNIMNKESHAQIYDMIRFNKYNINININIYILLFLSSTSSWQPSFGPSCLWPVSARWKGGAWVM